MTNSTLRHPGALLLLLSMVVLLADGTLHLMSHHAHDAAAPCSLCAPTTVITPEQACVGHTTVPTGDDAAPGGVPAPPAHTVASARPTRAPPGSATATL